MKKIEEQKEDLAKQLASQKQIADEQLKLLQKEIQDSKEAHDQKVKDMDSSINEQAKKLIAKDTELQKLQI